MARIAIILTLTALITASIGCAPNSSISRAQTPVISASSYDLSDVGEVDLVEQMAENRQAYRQNLEALSAYYARTGNNQKLTWANKEIANLDRMPQYTYIRDVIPGPDLKARMVLPEATALYLDAEQLQRDSGLIPLIGLQMPYVKSENLLRLALDKYASLIRKYPTCDRIDDAAFQAGYIHENFGEYDLALTFYQRAYQWDAQTPYPARFKAAYMLDKRLHRKSEAVDLYQQALNTEGLRYPEWQKFAQERIAELTKTGVADK